MSRGDVVSTRLDPDDLAVIAAAAQAEHSTISEFMRGAVLRAALARRPGARCTRNAAGAEVVIWTNAPGLVTT